LNTINPKLVNNQITIDSVDVGVMPLSEGEQYRLAQTQTSVSSKKFARSSYYDQLKTISAQYGIPHCLLQVAIQRESAGGAGAKLVGHDEDVASAGIRSRREFIASGIKFNKSTFAAGIGLGDKKLMNTDHGTPYHSAPNPNAADLGLDWRFSHSIGLFGVTFGPNNLPISGAKAVYDSVAVDMGIAAKTMNAFYTKCSKNVEWTWRAYASGSCKGGTNGSSDLFVNKETPIRVDLYNQCVAQDR
jgi:hypothetical protein